MQGVPYGKSLKCHRCTTTDLDAQIPNYDRTLMYSR